MKAPGNLSCLGPGNVLATSQIMPFATIAVVEGVFSPAEKQQLMTRVAEAMISIEGECLREKTVVILTEVKSGDWCIGGQALSADEIRRLREPPGNSLQHAGVSRPQTQRG